MLIGIATASLPDSIHRGVSATLEVDKKAYVLTVEEAVTRLFAKDGKMIENVSPPQTCTLRFSTLDEFFEWEHDFFEGFSSLGQEVEIDLADDAVHSLMLEVTDVLLFGGAAHFEDSGAIVFDSDEEKCRRLIREAAPD
jgi:hypothetical protein